MEYGQPSRVRLDIGAGYDRLAQARAGVLGVFEVRYNQSGTYTVSLPDEPGLHQYRSADGPHYWRSHPDQLPGASTTVTIQ